MKINKGTIRNINKKLISGLLIVSLAAPLAGCDSKENTGSYSWLEYKKDDSGAFVCNDVMTYEQIRDTKVIELGFDGRQTVYLAYLIDYSTALSNRSRTYYNVFGGQILYVKPDDDTELTILYEANLVDYLVSYDKVQDTYKEEELKKILEQIKADYEIQKEKDKQLVKE